MKSVMGDHRLSIAWLLPPLSAFGIISVLILSLILQKTGGHFVYLSDDPYMHLSMAAHLASSGIWGVSFDSFSNSSSSPFWTLLLSLTGRHPALLEKMPLYLNLASAIVLLLYLWLTARQRGMAASTCLVFLLSVVLFTPLTVVCFTGMEHVLHALLTLVFILWFTKSEKPPLLTLPVALLIVVMIPVRLESVFVILPAMLLYFGNKRGTEFIKTAVLSMLPLVVMGFFSRSQGGLFLPNPVALSGNFPGISTVTLFQFAGKALLNAARAPHLIGLVILCIVLLQLHKKGVLALSAQTRNLYFIFIASSLLHLLFARVGGFYRYESYLMVLGFCALFLSWPEWSVLFQVAEPRTTPRWGFTAYLALVAVLLFGRGAMALNEAPLAAKNLFERQYQAGLFLKEFEEGAGVVVQEAGAAAFLGKIHVLDMRGFGHDKIARLKKTWRFSTQDLTEMAEQERASLAIVSDTLFYQKGVSRLVSPLFSKLPILSFLKPYFIRYGIGAVPSQWKRIADWSFSGQDDNRISFYSLNSESASALSEKLRTFGPKLPTGVKAVYY